MPQCEITGINAPYSLFGCHNHHYIKQQHLAKYPEFFEREGIKQREMWLYCEVHDSLHHQSEKTFLETYGPIYFERTGKELKKSDFLFNKKEYLKGLYA